MASSLPGSLLGCRCRYRFVRPAAQLPFSLLALSFRHLPRDSHARQRHATPTKIPILSHIYQEDEVSFAEFTEPNHTSLKSRPGYLKIVAGCRGHGGLNSNISLLIQAASTRTTTQSCPRLSIPCSPGTRNRLSASCTRWILADRYSREIENPDGLHGVGPYKSSWLPERSSFFDQTWKTLEGFGPLVPRITFTSGISESDVTKAHYHCCLESLQKVPIDGTYEKGCDPRFSSY